MQQQNWHFSDDALDTLLKGEYATEISNEVTYRLLTTIEDTENRLLLYRLNLIWGDFSLEDIEAVAYVDPAIERVRERLHALTGLWLQGTARERLTVSPLVGFWGPRILDHALGRHVNWHSASAFYRKARLINRMPYKP